MKYKFKFKCTKQNPEYDEDTSFFMILPCFTYSVAWDGSRAFTLGWFYWVVQFSIFN